MSKDAYPVVIPPATNNDSIVIAAATTVGNGTAWLYAQLMGGVNLANFLALTMVLSSVVTMVLALFKARQEARHREELFKIEAVMRVRRSEAEIRRIEAGACEACPASLTPPPKGAGE